MKYIPVIGLEIHAQLSTNSKIFCGCSTNSESSANSHVCITCSGQPGALPRFNKKALELAIKAGIALNCKINCFSQFQRKNYFYPDLPKGYQITQNDFPICGSGSISIETQENEKKNIRIHHIHLEEDAGKSVHEKGSTFVNLNRAGVPLIEIVTEPDMNSAFEAVQFMKKVHSLLTSCQISSGNMEKGNFRADVNVSVMKETDKKFGQRVEIKNVNSFKFVEKAIEYEISRQISCLESNEIILQQTRTFDSDAGITHAMRDKENAHDYRYFPDPDLPNVVFEESLIAQLRSELPELPDIKMARYQQNFSLKKEDAYFISHDEVLSRVFEILNNSIQDPPLVCNWLVGDFLGFVKSNNLETHRLLELTSELCSLLTLVEKDVMSGKIAKSLLEEVFQGKDPGTLVANKGLIQVTDLEQIKKFCETVIQNNPSQVEQYRSGKDKLFGFFVGQVMKLSQGKVNPDLTNQILKGMLDK